MGQIDRGTCESCGRDDARTQRNRFPDGTSLVCCHSCVGQIRHWWRIWSQYIQPAQARRVAGEPEPIADGGTITACPECDSSQIRVCGGRSIRTTEASDTRRWRCEACKHRFDDPTERAPKGSTRAPQHGLARHLDRMDPDDIATDGGTAVCRNCDRASETVGEGGLCLIYRDAIGDAGASTGGGE